MNNTLGHERAAQRKTGFYAGLERRTELVGGNDIGIDEQLTQPVC